MKSKIMTQIAKFLTLFNLYLIFADGEKSTRSSTVDAHQSNSDRHKTLNQNGEENQCVQKYVPRRSGGFIISECVSIVIEC